MKTFVFTLIISSILLIGLQQQTVPEIVSDTVHISNFDHFDDCKYYQFVSNDSLNTRLTRSQLIDSRGRVIAVNSERFQIDNYTFTSSGKTFRSYDDEGNLIQVVNHRRNPNMIEPIINFTIHEYGDNKLVNTKRYIYRHRLKDESIHQHLLSAEDFEPPSWKLESDEYFYYDERGRLIESNAPEFHTTNQTRYTYIYDENDQLLVKTSFSGEKIVWKEQYTHSNDTTKYKRVWFNDGVPDESRAVLIFAKVIDSDGETIYEKTEREGEIIGEIEYFYNVEGLVLKMVEYGKDREILLTTIKTCN